MEKSFSQRRGFKPAKTSFQVNSMDDDLRLALWNDLTRYIWSPYANWSKFRDLLDQIWTNFFKKSLDSFNSSNVYPTYIRKSYFEMEWYEVYDFIEFIIHTFAIPYAVAELIDACNSTLENERSGYRLVGALFVPITSEQEVAEIHQALDTTEQFTSHLNKAIELLANRTSPDYANSIKESISAVEALCKLITDDRSTTLGEALEKLDRKGITLHKSLKDAFRKLYGYTSDAQGIRHGLVGRADLDGEDARFMLVTCSAFIN